MRQCRYRLGVVSGRQSVRPCQLVYPEDSMTIQRTCWLISTMPMSFLSVVNR